jgi:hypothetical protein
MRWGTLAYFSTMELLQAFTYSVIGVCALTNTIEGKWNEILTILSYLHICFQPLFLNLFGISFSVKLENIKKLLKTTIPIILISCFLMIARLFPSEFWGLCDYIKSPLCGLDTCSYFGDWHIAWRLTLNSFDEISIFNIKIVFLSYHLPIFILPFFYGGWRWSLYQFFYMLISMSLTNNKDEWPAIWCIGSIGILGAIYIPFIRNWIETPLRKK